MCCLPFGCHCSPLRLHCRWRHGCHVTCFNWSGSRAGYAGSLCARLSVNGCTYKVRLRPGPWISSYQECRTANSRETRYIGHKTVQDRQPHTSFSTVIYVLNTKLLYAIVPTLLPCFRPFCYPCTFLSLFQSCYINCVAITESPLSEGGFTVISNSPRPY